MKSLKGEKVYLRALEPEDLEYIHTLENDESLWHLSNTQTPFSRYLIKQYIENAHRDIFEVKQLRLMICKLDGENLGLIDLFDCDFKNSRAGIGIVIKNPQERGLGYGKEAVRLLMDYSFNFLNFHQLYCNISEDNASSKKLFSDLGFEVVGLKKDWNYNDGEFKNEYLFQFIGD